MCSKEVSLAWNERRLNTAGNKFVKASLVFGWEYKVEKNFFTKKKFLLAELNGKCIRELMLCTLERHEGDDEEEETILKIF